MPHLLILLYVTYSSSSTENKYTQADVSRYNTEWDKEYYDRNTFWNKENKTELEKLIDSKSTNVLR
eukprot:9584836-Ditylum_brightwellii.AAC.1